MISYHNSIALVTLDTWEGPNLANGFRPVVSGECHVLLSILKHQTSANLMMLQKGNVVGSELKAGELF